MVHSAGSPSPISAAFDGRRIVVSCDDGSVWTAHRRAGTQPAAGFAPLPATGRLFHGGGVLFVDDHGRFWRALPDGLLERVNDMSLPNASPIVDLDHTQLDWMARCADGTVWVTGSNGRGHHGVGHTDSSVDAWVRMDLPTAVDRIAISSWSTVALDLRGQLWLAGTDLGAQPTPPWLRPRYVDSPAPMSQVAMSATCRGVVALDADGVVWAIGPWRPQLAELSHPDGARFSCVTRFGLGGLIGLVDSDGRAWTVEMKAYPTGVPRIVPLPHPEPVAAVICADDALRWVRTADGAHEVVGQFGNTVADAPVRLPPFATSDFALLSELAMSAEPDTPLEGLVAAAARL